MKKRAIAFAALALAAAHAEEQTVKTEKATLGGGCFWCVEAIYENVPGILSVTSGYAGGHKADPTYEEVCRGNTGHAEVVQIAYDPAKVSYEKIVDLFWDAHDPTTRDRQGPDTGPQYRSIILFSGADQERVARASLERAQKRFPSPIVTQIVPLEKFYPAESYHQNFAERNPSHPYIQSVLQPKLEKLKAKEAKAP